jgi:hypothetical protein
MNDSLLLLLIPLPPFESLQTWEIFADQVRALPDSLQKQLLLEQTERTILEMKHAERSEL